MVFSESLTNCVIRDPRRIVPPIIVVLISGIKQTTGLLVVLSNSSLFASCNPKTFRAYSITAICRPKQIPKKGILFSRAYFATLILPSVPRDPKPPGTKIPLYINSSHVILLCRTNSCPGRVICFYIWI